MKKFVRCLMVALILPVALMFVGCSSSESAVSIWSIKKTDSVGLVDTYTITYSNGQTEQFTITNGEDGENLYTNITINDLYNQVKGSKPAGYSLLDFIDEYLDIELDGTAVASSKGLRSAVSIYVEHPVLIPDYNNIIGYTQTPYGLQPNYGTKQSIVCGAGSGVIYQLDKTTGDAYIITNYHVCYSGDSIRNDGIATRITLYTYGAETPNLTQMAYLSYYNSNCKEYKSLFEEYDATGVPVIDYGYGAIEAEFVGGSEQYDIAVLKVSGSELLKNSDCLAVDVKNSDDVTPGTNAIAIGNPNAYGIAVTDGVVSVDNEYISVQISDSAVVLREFRIDTPAYQGNSGGGLYDGFGNLIGIVNAKDPDEAIENICYAIPSNIATRVADSIIDMCDGINTKIKKLFMGVTIQVVDSKGYYDSDTGLMRIDQTMKVSDIQANSLAYNIGLNIGDEMVSVEIISQDGSTEIEINRLFILSDALLMVREGDTVKFNCIRNGESCSFTTPTLTSDYFVEVA